MSASNVVTLVALLIDAVLAPIGSGYLMHLLLSRRRARRQAEMLPVYTPWQYAPTAFAEPAPRQVQR